MGGQVRRSGLSGPACRPRREVSLRPRHPLPQFIYFCLEAAAHYCAHPDNPDGKLVAVFDLDALQLRNLDSAALRASFSMLEQHFPERVAEICEAAGRRRWRWLLQRLRRLCADGAPPSAAQGCLRRPPSFGGEDSGGVRSLCLVTAACRTSPPAPAPASTPTCLRWPAAPCSIWKVVHPFIDATTRSRIHFVYGKEGRAAMLKVRPRARGWLAACTALHAQRHVEEACACPTEPGP